MRRTGASFVVFLRNFQRLLGSFCWVTCSNSGRFDEGVSEIRGFNLRGSSYLHILALPGGRNKPRTPKRFRCARTYLMSSIIMAVARTLHAAGELKMLSFLSVCQSVCLSLCPSRFERQSLRERLRPERVRT